jgi:hypothetical protein
LLNIALTIEKQPFTLKSDRPAKMNGKSCPEAENVRYFTYLSLVQAFSIPALSNPSLKPLKINYYE